MYACQSPLEIVSEGLSRPSSGRERFVAVIAIETDRHVTRDGLLALLRAQYSHASCALPVLFVGKDIMEMSCIGEHECICFEV